LSSSEILFILPKLNKNKSYRAYQPCSLSAHLLDAMTAPPHAITVAISNHLTFFPTLQPTRKFLEAEANHVIPVEKITSLIIHQ